MQTQNVNHSNAADREVTFTRVFNAPARLVYLAYTTPEHMKSWFGPRGYPLTMCEMDFRVGGKWRAAMTPDGQPQHMTPFGGEYLEIIPNQKISYSNRFEEAGAETMIVTVLLDEKDGKTTLTLHTLFGSAKMKEEHLARGYEQGSESAWKNLDRVLASHV